jgi:hypothetical protein
MLIKFLSIFKFKHFFCFFHKTIPPINLGNTLQRPSAQPLQLINQTLASRSSYNQVSSSCANNMWQNNQLPNAALISINNQPLNQSQQQQQQQQQHQQSGIISSSSNKPHAALRTRPISAANSNGRLFKDVPLNTNAWSKGLNSVGTNVPSPVIDSETYRQVN